MLNVKTGLRSFFEEIKKVKFCLCQKRHRLQMKN